MNEDDTRKKTLKNFSDEIDNLVEELMNSGNSQNKKLASKFEQIRLNRKVKFSIPELIASLGYLRFSVKYLIFDLEATRRENKYLRDLLDGKKGEL